MAQTLVKFKHIEDISDNTNYIEAIFSDSPLSILELSKATGTVVLKDEPYIYEFSEFIPAVDRDLVDVLMIYVDGYLDSDENCVYLN